MICVNKNNFCYVIIIAVLDLYKINVTLITTYHVIEFNYL
jgi:hypothetical protein